MGRLVLMENGITRDRKPPAPPQPSRFMICTDDDMFRDVRTLDPKMESQDETSSSSDESSIAGES